MLQSHGDELLGRALPFGIEPTALQFCDIFPGQAADSLRYQECHEVCRAPYGWLQDPCFGTKCLQSHFCICDHGQVRCLVNWVAWLQPPDCLLRCAGRLSSLADQCESSPSLMALAAVPNVGGLVSFVCGQAAALVEK